MRCFRPDEIITSVVRWAHDKVMCRQCFESVLKHGWREVWAVAVEGNDMLPVFPWMTFLWMIGREVRKYRREACSQPLAFLCDHIRIATRQLFQLLNVR